MAHVSWVEDANGTTWWVKGPIQHEQNHIVTVSQGLVVYRPEDKTYTATYSPYLMKRTYAMKIFNSLEEAQSWLMVMVRMG